MDFLEVVSKRRSHREFSGESLSFAVVESLLQTAILAPNHRRNQPWRFTVVLQENMPKFWELLRAEAATIFARRDPVEAEKKIAKLAKQLPKIGALLYVTVMKDVKENITRENYAAACCAVQNCMLAATNMGLGSFWSTGEIFAHKNCAEILGIDFKQEDFVGAIWLGKVLDNPEPPIYELLPRLKVWQ